MSQNKVFCSYSSHDREGVLSIVKLLKKKGVDVWIDQLDIKMGERWDEGIEIALEESTSLLLFISKSSMASSNVMDEFSYAMSEGKRIVPIRLEECELPLRMRRIQLIDLVNNYDNGIRDLLRALDGKRLMEDDNIREFQSEQIDVGIDNDVVDYNVFISYNHGDLSTALKIRDLLVNSGIEVTIDQDSMRIGEEIKSFINESIQKADAVLTLISNKSLKSGWVGAETFDTMFTEAQSGKRKLIGCVLDSDFYNYDYTINTIEDLDEEIESRKKVLVKQLQMDVSVTDISSEIDRLRKLRQNFPETMKRLRDFKCIDVSNDDIISYNIDKFVEQLKRPPII